MEIWNGCLKLTCEWRGQTSSFLQRFLQSIWTKITNQILINMLKKPTNKHDFIFSIYGFHHNHRTNMYSQFDGLEVSH